MWLETAQAAVQPGTRSFQTFGLESGTELALWLALVLFAIGLAVYRRRLRPYLGAFVFAGLFAAARAVPRLLPDAWGPALALEACARLALPYFIMAASESRLPRPAGIALMGIPILAAAASVMETILPATAAWAPAAALWILGLHSLALCFLALGRSRGQPQTGFILPALAAWTLAQFSRMAPLPGLEPWTAAFEAASAFLLGASLLMSAMLELARPSPDDTVLDDRVARMTASVRRFIPNEFLQQLHKAEVEDLKLGDHIKKDMTIFFSDIRAFTQLSEALTPEQSFAFINSYLSRVVPLVTEHRGFVDKYMGDAIMALFAETGGPDDAVEAAIDMQKKMIEYNYHRSKMEYRPISMGIGIHTGTLMLGVVGVSDRMEGTVISDSVNLASRLQAIAKQFNCPLIISEHTFMALTDPGKYKYRFIGKVRVKGKDAPISAFEIFDGLPEEEFEHKMKANTFFEQGMLAYYQKAFTEAVFYFKRSLEALPGDGASRFYLETCLRKTMTMPAS